MPAETEFRKCVQTHQMLFDVQLAYCCDRHASEWEETSGCYRDPEMLEAAQQVAQVQWSQLAFVQLLQRHHWNLNPSR